MGFFNDCTGKENYTRICNGSFDLGSDFQTRQYKNTSSVYSFSYTLDLDCFRKWEDSFTEDVKVTDRCITCKPLAGHVMPSVQEKTAREWEA